MIINLNSCRDISYRILDTDNIKQIEYIISFPSGYKHSFPVYLDKNTGLAEIHLPVLKDIVRDEYDGLGYIRVTRTDDTFKDLEEETVRFCSSFIIHLDSDQKEPSNKATLNMTDVKITNSTALRTIMSNIDRNKK